MPLMCNRSSHCVKLRTVIGETGRLFGVRGGRVDAEGEPLQQSLWGCCPLGNYRNLAANSGVGVSFCIKMTYIGVNSVATIVRTNQKTKVLVLNLINIHV